MVLTDFLMYVEGDTVIHRLDPRTKVVWIAATMFLSIFVEVLSVKAFDFSHVFLGFTLLLSIIPWYIAKIPWNKAKLPWLVVSLTGISMIVQQTLFYHSTIREPFLVWQRAYGTATTRIYIIYPDIYITLEGIIFGVTRAMKIAIPGFISMLMVMTTPISKITAGMRKIGIPFKASFLVTTALRFVPLFLEEVQTVLNAQRARGLDIFLKRPTGFIRFLSRSTFPTLVGAVRRAYDLTLSIESRAFGIAKERTTLIELKLQKADYFMISVLIIWVVISVIVELIIVGSLPLALKL